MRILQNLLFSILLLNVKLTKALDERSESWLREETTFMLDPNLDCINSVYYALCNKSEPAKCRLKRWNLASTNKTGTDCEMEISQPDDPGKDDLFELVSVKHRNCHTALVALQFREKQVNYDFLTTRLVHMPGCTDFRQESDRIAVYDNWEFDIKITPDDRGIGFYKFSYDDNGIRQKMMYLKLDDLDLDDTVSDSVNNNVFTRGYNKLEKSYVVIDIYGNIRLTFKPALEVVSWSNKKHYVICHTIERTKIACNSFLANGTEVQNFTLEYPRPIKLIRAQAESVDLTKGESEDEIMIVTENADCVGKDCWNVTLTIVKSNGSFISKNSTFNCTGSSKKLALVFLKTNKNKAFVLYVCECIDEDDDRKSHLELGRVWWIFNDVEFQKNPGKNLYRTELKKVKINETEIE